MRFLKSLNKPNLLTFRIYIRAYRGNTLVNFARIQKEIHTMFFFLETKLSFSLKILVEIISNRIRKYAIDKMEYKIPHHTFHVVYLVYHRHWIKINRINAHKTAVLCSPYNYLCVLIYAYLCLCLSHYNPCYLIEVVIHWFYIISSAQCTLLWYFGSCIIDSICFHLLFYFLCIEFHTTIKQKQKQKYWENGSDRETCMNCLISVDIRAKPHMTFSYAYWAQSIYVFVNTNE